MHAGRAISLFSMLNVCTCAFVLGGTIAAVIADTIDRTAATGWFHRLLCSMPTRVSDGSLMAIVILADISAIGCFVYFVVVPVLRGERWRGDTRAQRWLSAANLATLLVSELAPHLQK